mmetsp:Transcript_20742/g.45175  ORF Transcript_20742/g.45175 Transcript_20742/m.45175 type:complete len:117 (+) Transcript_20742:147-497(+)|eukprot:CAMPEP_0168179708 /NCGR_PEP_ID=MMETSP0139_2-20121125/10017_1 /TAXON_ID=44445 /ORGANISM="Pseudo-nitzschia australis, Strain 10249 10 AB" /LENGTH=116 /DNA_ID=CAMNT_0008099615 /DNA_START=229 /DNA_END=579 /DNA_ORIENTATION=+
MSSTRTSAASTRSILPRLVRSLSAFHAAKKDKTTTSQVFLGAAFSREHFPKTLAASCFFFFGVGFHGMNRWQQNRQLRWEQKQEELETHFYNNYITNKDQASSTETVTRTISTTAG